MPQPITDEGILTPLSFEGRSLPDSVKLLNDEQDRLVANARSIAFYAIRSSMRSGKGSVAQSQRTYLYMELADLVELLAREAHLYSPSELRAQYGKLEELARSGWDLHGGVLVFDASKRPPPEERP